MQSLNIITERVLQYGLRLNFETHVFHKADALAIVCLDLELKFRLIAWCVSCIQVISVMNLNRLSDSGFPAAAGLRVGIQLTNFYQGVRS